MEKLNVNCAEKILEAVGIDQVKPLLDTLSIRSDLISFQSSGLEYDRLDPRRLFRQLVKDPDELMKVMRECNVVLSGSRAVEYFMPGSCTQDSDWDFYLLSNEPVRSSIVNDTQVTNACYDSNTVSFEAYMETLGIQWESPISTEDWYDELHLQDIKTGKLITKHETEAKVQLIYVGNQGILNTIVRFHSTTPQCFISGSAVVHMYSSLVHNKEYIEWTSTNDRTRSRQLYAASMGCLRCNYMSDLYGNRRIDVETLNQMRNEFESTYSLGNEENIAKAKEKLRLMLSRINNILSSDIEKLVYVVFESCTCKPDDPNLKALQKYVSRGYKQVELRDYISRTKRWRTCHDFMHCFRVRYIGDEDSKIISFEGYVTDEADKIIVRDQKDKLREFSWYEYPYGTASINDAKSDVFRKGCFRYTTRNPGGL